MPQGQLGQLPLGQLPPTSQKTQPSRTMRSRARQQSHPQPRLSQMRDGKAKESDNLRSQKIKAKQFKTKNTRANAVEQVNGFQHAQHSRHDGQQRPIKNRVGQCEPRNDSKSAQNKRHERTARMTVQKRTRVFRQSTELIKNAQSGTRRRMLVCITHHLHRKRQHIPQVSKGAESFIDFSALTATAIRQTRSSSLVCMLWLLLEPRN